jgi:peptide/nickel transport system permease protein
MSLRDRDFVRAARIIGESRRRIMFNEIGPNLLPIIASSLLFTILYSVGVYTTLAFLGLTSVTSWNWGTMLYWAQTNNAALAKEWWWIAPPGIAIALVGTSLALINFGIDEFINPRLRAGGMSARQRKKAGQARRPRLGFTPVLHHSNATEAGR